MIVKQRKLELPKNLLFNIGGVSIIALAGILAMRSSLVKDEIPLCDARYSGGVLFSLARPSGEPLSTEDIQARLGGRDWGLTANTRVVPDAAVTKGQALEISMRAASDRDADGQTRSGMGFTWQPRQLAPATSACLSYNFWTPADFKHGDGGVLPGLLSDGEHDPSGPATPAAADAATAEPQPFRLRAQWRADGAIGLFQSTNLAQKGIVHTDLAKAAMKVGAWNRIEQEVVLNTPGQSNGLLRLWVNGKLVVDRKDLGYRKDDMQSFQAVSIEVHYLRNGNWSPSPADTRVRLSPLELRLN